jgi:hypothetical protein
MGYYIMDFYYGYRKCGKGQLFIILKLQEKYITQDQINSLKICLYELRNQDWYFQKHSNGKITVETQKRLITK